MAPECAPAILVVDDEAASVDLLRITLGREHTVHTATDGPTALRLLEAHPEIGVAIIDQRMPGMTGTQLIEQMAASHPDIVCIILTGYTDVEALIQAINAGHVYRYLTKPWHKDELVATTRQGVEVYQLARENRRLQEELRVANARLQAENVRLRREVRACYGFDQIIGTSAALRRALDLVERVVPRDCTVLLLGETGTGKELVARAIHYNGPRAERPFISENCGAIGPDVLTSELFGHRRGAFTGAINDRKGLFEAADGGTIFLDEIGDCPPDLQTRLLRVLDQGEIRRMGDSRPTRVDVRVIAATHHDLEHDVAEGTFRKDLFYRLSVVGITLPPLRERKEDIPALVQSFLDRHARGRPIRGVTPAALEALAAYDFPGNVRELENEIERAVTLADDDGYITGDLLSPKFNGAGPGVPAPNGPLRQALERYEAQLIRDALAQRDGNQTRTAADLGLSRRALIDKLQKYGLRTTH
ncbi:MAG: sigma-54 dependent transcriptional regulator [Candidatus Binatia bacterium]